MRLKEFIKYLNKDNICDKNIPTDYLSGCYENYETKKSFIILSLGIGIPIYTIEFDTYISWEIKNSMGDGYITENYDYVEDLEIEIDLINIEDYSHGVSIELDDTEFIIKIEDWVKSIIKN
jgi:hypothetical protein